MTDDTLTSEVSRSSTREAWPYDSALCLLALAMSLVPFRSIVPSLRSFISWLSTRTCTSNPLGSGRNRRRNVASVFEAFHDDTASANKAGLTSNRTEGRPAF